MQKTILNPYNYDLETYPNCFLFAGKFVGRPDIYVFEISDRMNDRDALLSHINYLQNAGVLMIGFNNLQFDNEILHALINEPYTFTAMKAHLLGSKIIATQSYGSFPRNMRPSDRKVPQCDLVKVHHFDNPNKRTPLKSLQFAMRSQSVEDLPFDIRPLTFAEMDELRRYNVHDLTETEKFTQISWPMIELRQALLDEGVLTGDVLNFSDVKIGEEYLIKKIGRHRCFNGRNPKQTRREIVELKNVVLPKISFRNEEFQAVVDWFRSQVVWTDSKYKKPPKLSNVWLGGLEFFFGVGGAHASVESQVFHSNDEYIIKDVDVSGMYPAIAVANNFYPEHLGQDFLVAYKQLQIDRKQYKKGTMMNLVLKLANNGVFGKGDNEYSCFYDPAFPKKITINGQLQLLQLAELLWMVPGTRLIQCNTDGISAYVRRENEALFNMWCKIWEEMTLLKLEYVDFKSMWIRDVNNYLAIDLDGKIKRKGAYWYPITIDDYQGSSGSTWNKDFSNIASIKCAERALIDGLPPERIIRSFTDKFDFMLREKTPKDAKIYIGEKVMQKTVRYYVSTKGAPMKKITAADPAEKGQFKRKNKLSDEFFDKVMAEIPPGTWDARIHTANKSVYEDVTTSIQSGWLVKECNNVKDFDWKDVDYDYYIEEAKKLLIGGQ